MVVVPNVVDGTIKVCFLQIKFEGNRPRPHFVNDLIGL